jgi:hypothetical protein
MLDAKRTAFQAVLCVFHERGKILVFDNPITSISDSNTNNSSKLAHEIYCNERLKMIWLKRADLEKSGILGSSILSEEHLPLNTLEELFQFITHSLRENRTESLSVIQHCEVLFNVQILCNI